jgi:hypothetical protein
MNARKLQSPARGRHLRHCIPTSKRSPARTAGAARGGPIRCHIAAGAGVQWDQQTWRLGALHLLLPTELKPT